MSLEITPAARAKLRHFMASNPGFVPKIAVQSGGCSGFKYVIGLDHKLENDLELQIEEDLVVLVPADSIDYLENVVLDYQARLMSEGFSFSNPSAHSCGCGSSFRPKEAESCD